MKEIYAKFNILLETVKTGKAVQVSSLDKRTIYWGYNWRSIIGANLEGLFKEVYSSKINELIMQPAALDREKGITFGSS